MNECTEKTGLLAEQNRVRHKTEVLATCIAALGSLSFGWALGYSSPAIPDLKEAGILDADNSSWFGSLVTLGAVPGAIISLFLPDISGRKGAIILANLPFMAGWILLASTRTLSVLYVGRILTGVGMGIISATVPLYIGETVTKEYRGLFGTFTQLFLSMGVFITYVLAIPLTWNWIAVAAASVCGLHILVLIFIPETPRWYLKKGKREQAMKSLRWLRGADVNIHIECQEIEVNIVNQPTSTPLSHIKYPKYYKPLIIGVMLHIGQKLVGMNVVQFYTQSIFEAAGYVDNANIPPVIVGAVGILGCGPSLLLMDKLGRKTLLILSGILLFLSTFLLGLFFYLTSHGATGLDWIPVASIIVYTFSISVGWGPIPWLILPEIFPLNIRGLGCGVATLSNWTVGFVITKWFPVLTQTTSDYFGFWLLAVFSILAVIFVGVFVPETKGKSLEEIETFFDNQTNERTQKV